MSIMNSSRQKLRRWKHTCVSAALVRLTRRSFPRPAYVWGSAWELWKNRHARWAKTIRRLPCRVSRPTCRCHQGRRNPQVILCAWACLPGSGVSRGLLLLMPLALPSARSFAQRLLSTLRIEKVQTVALDLSSFDGVPSNSKIQEAISQMISDNVVVTTNEKPLPASTKQDASSLAGFPVRLPAARTAAPQFHVEGAHAFHMTVDRARLQDILDQAGRTDLILPASLDGASVSVQIPRSVGTAYGNCPQHQRNGAGSSSSSSP